MKLKSLGKTSFLFLVLSFQPLYADVKGTLTADDCESSSKRSEMNAEQTKQCNEFQTRLESIENSSRTKDDKQKAITAEYNRFARDADYATKVATENAGKIAQNDYCLNKTKQTKPPSKETNFDGSYGSSGLVACQSLSLGNMSTLYASGSRANFDWEPYISYSCREFCEKGTAEFKTCVDKSQALAKKCESVAHVINAYGRKWTDEDQNQPVSAEKSSAPVAARTTQTANGGTASVAIGAASTIKCVSKGIETIDYDVCKKFQVQLDIIESVQQVGYATQELVYKDKLMDSQAKYAAEKNTATGALKATSESLRDQESMLQQRTAVDSTKLAYLYSIYNEMPKAADLKAKCKEISRISPQGLGAIDPNECEPAIIPGTGPFATLMNQQQIEAMRTKLIQIATSAGSNLLLSNLLGKRAGDVDNAIAKIDAFKPIDPFTTTESEAQTTFCRMNPGAAQCLTGDLDRTFDTMNDNVITFGDAATGTNYGSSGNLDGSGVTTGAIADTTARAPVAPVGSIIAAAAQDNSIEGSSAAKVTAGGTGSSGGGGSGGGGSAGGGGGGGGAPAAGAAGGQASAVASRAPSYSGGGGSFSVMGGFGINKKKSDGKAEDNPFGKLFGKDGAKGGGVVNFRDIASQKVGGKGDNLFDMISKRYSDVSADKRLLEYELTK